MECFRELGIVTPILKAIEDAKFEKPTEIQEKSIPLILAGKDVIAGAATGSGKTLAFASGIIRDSERGSRIQALVLTPTRELAQQVTAALSYFSRYKPLKHVAVFGGVAINPQIEKLRTADVVIGTPGRILDHIGRRTIKLGKINTLVLDEADRMLDMGFIDDVEQIIKECPVKRQTLLFSATISKEIAHLARRYMDEPVHVSAETYVDPSKLTQFYYDVPDNLKFSLLVHLLKHEEVEVMAGAGAKAGAGADTGLAMVFCNTRKNTDFLGNNLKAVGINAMAIHGGLTQERRNRVMKQFHAEDVRVLVCTDVAARGLDIPSVTQIYNYDIPRDSKDYIHRIGRTARAGKEGRAISILSSRDYDSFRRVMRLNGIAITEKTLPDVKKVRIKFKVRGSGFRGQGSRFKVQGSRLDR